MIENDEEIISIANPEVVDKFKAAATVANAALAYVAGLCQPGASVIEVCKAGDAYIEAETAKVFAKKKFLRGTSFPTCISVNNTVCNFSPLSSDPAVVIQEGDVVKIDLGAHFDGYPSQIGHTIVATANPQQPITGRKADVICAAHFAGECALRLCRPGNKASQITKVIQDVADVFKCNPVADFRSFQVERNVIEGEKSIPNRKNEEENDEDCTFAENEVYILDILMSSGSGKPKLGDAKTTVYKKTENMYNLKLAASRYVLTEASKRFGNFPFTLRSLDEKRGRLGIVECSKNNLMDDYPVVYEQDGEFVAQFKFTVLLLPNSIQKLNAFNLPFVQSEYNITEPALTSVLQMGLKRKSNAKKKKKKKKKAATQAMDTSA